LVWLSFLGIVFILSTFIVLVHQSFGFVGMDSNRGPQKIHEGSVPRFGGAAIFLGCLIGLGFWDEKFLEILLLLLLAALPVFVAGLAEDLTGHVAPLFRLIASIISGAAFCWLSGYTITNVGIDFLTVILVMPFLSTLFTVSAIATLINSFNIIDGLNGLCGGCGIIMLTGFGVLAGQTGDVIIEGVCFSLIALIAGFLIWNFPFGKIFLGDCGAYLIGATVAGVSIMLPENNHELSPFVSLMIIVFPLYELLRSAIRRISTSGFKAFEPDRKHFHSVLFKVIEVSNGFPKHLQNSLATILTLLLPLFCCIWGLVFFNDRFFLISGIVGFVIIYETLLMSLNALERAKIN
jgi:UDP-N-acetylmuramyl pentapeptide phosphotransferase/UDP-N-acetylglucosamine-1-phosphate transferase